MPSLAQLDQAVREFLAENPNDAVTVVVDASFGHRIDPSELPTFEGAEVAGEVVSPPAGAIGRGDAFLLRIAEKMGATVLSNDSFQEFHGEHPWLFEKGRLIGGKPVPGVGWIFMDRTPVRGAKSREVVKEAKRRKRAEGDETAAAAVTAQEAKAPAGDGGRPRARPKAVDRAIARATQEVVEPKTGSKSRRRRGGQPPAEPVNEPLAFITFIAAHPLGSEVVGSVVEYSSHGAFVDADGARCYIPLSAMGEPPPRRAREVVSKAEARAFTVQAFDPQRRGIELALPEFARVAGGPTAETVEAEIRQETPKPKKTVGRGKARTAPAAEATAPLPPPAPTPPEPPAREAIAAEPVAGQPGPTKKAPPRKAPSRKAVSKEKGPEPAAPPEAATPAEPAKKAPGKKAPARKAATKKAAGPTKAAAAKKAPAPAEATASAPAPAPAKKTTAAKAATKKAAQKEPGAKKQAVKKAAPRKEPVPKKTAVKKEPAARKAGAKKAAAKEPGATKTGGPADPEDTLPGDQAAKAG